MGVCDWVFCKSQIGTVSVVVKEKLCCSRNLFSLAVSSLLRSHSICGSCPPDHFLSFPSVIHFSRSLAAVYSFDYISDSFSLSCSSRFAGPRLPPLLHHAFQERLPSAWHPIRSKIRQLRRVVSTYTLANTYIFTYAHIRMHVYTTIRVYR